MKQGPDQPFNISDFIGIIIAFLAFVYMSLRPLFQRLKNRNNNEPPQAPPYEDEEEEIAVKRAAQKPKKAKPKKWESDRFKFETSIEKRQKPSAIEQRKLDSSVQDRKLKELEDSFEEDITEEEAYAYTKDLPSKGKKALEKSTLRNALILSEIMGEPRGRRIYDGRPHGS